jgi:hypothetical protein|tara:strand:+ start:1063 stop:1401 length:339 start_codon:yes stop_codon:yes gene_type:complete
MIDIRFVRGSELVAVRIRGNQVFFSKIQGSMVFFSDIKGLRLNVGSILKEFPDLKTKPDEEIKKIAMQRFKDHVKSLPNEDAVMDYVVKDLKKHGYEARLKIKSGFRAKSLK